MLFTLWGKGKSRFWRNGYIDMPVGLSCVQNSGVYGEIHLKSDDKTMKLKINKNEAEFLVEDLIREFNIPMNIAYRNNTKSNKT